MVSTFGIRRVQISGIEHSVLLQEQNTDQTSSALVSLANVLLMSPGLARISQPLTELVGGKSDVSLGELVNVLARMGVQQNNTIGLEQLEQVLTQLSDDSGAEMKVDPKFIGSFEDGMEMSVFRLYNVGLVHGWIIDAEADPVAYKHVSQYSYESAQGALVQSYDIQKGTVQVADANAIVEDANYLKAFLARSATQLTDYGLHHLKEVMVEKSYAVLYRNEQFYTLHKSNGELFLLVTDTAYRNNSDIVWKSLTSVSGTQDSYYTGTFSRVDGGVAQKTLQNDATAISNVVSNPFGDNRGRNNKTVNAGQNADFVEGDEELARRLQQQEDEEYANAVANSNREHAAARHEQSPDSSFKEKSKSKRGRFFSKKKLTGKKYNGDSRCVLM
ncbi:Miy3p KNAG_0F02080 [Huiozyma naganishii CBS 8797]|uniref:MINDY deubiquitinase domain-containing protein n=1 Tax=Huiozyma naganishii (strain ATCC MYA-139 / BCRC 22969 / CBS 8797 / KCTC 17520 / NBRC 10181 / NCYC 3082 / Yp74L-3) TaxID=1071383 RepID=J7R7M7_HUIN7|nr:hypothetical protein KNAG_0F02080 [Kazachstania naganishii CBS 8797]CCK70875.1 hypothetical protein KNAG_0F02080 [Kazachstania naganishii CBS 8797]